MKILNLFTIFFILTLTTFAQVNIEKFRTLSDINGIGGSLKFDFSVQTGNKNVQLFGLEGRGSIKKNNNHFFLIGKGEYGWQGGKQFSNEALLHLRYVRKLYNNLSAELFTQIDYNKARLLLFRYLFGGGLRIKIYKTKNTSSHFGLATMYENERLDLPATAVHPNRTKVIRLSTYVTFRINIKKGVNLASVVYYQPKINDFGDARVLSENSLLVDISTHLGLSVELNIRYDRKPPDNIHDLDTKTKLGFSFKF